MKEKVKEKIFVRMKVGNMILENKREALNFTGRMKQRTKFLEDGNNTQDAQGLRIERSYNDGEGVTGMDPGSYGERLLLMVTTREGLGGEILTMQPRVVALGWVVRLGR